MIPWTVACQASLSFRISWSLPRFPSIESVMLSNHLILCCLVLFCLQSFPASGFFSNESTLHIKWQKYCSFSFSIPPSNEYFFRTDWFDLLAVQETLKSFLQHHNLKASILQPSAFFIVQLSHLYMTTGKTIALTRWTSVGKVMSLLFNMLSKSLAYLSFQGASVF